MNFKQFKESLKYRKYNNWKILIRFIEYKFKDNLISLIINFNFFKFNSKQLIDIGSYNDNRYINFLLYSLKDDYLFLYQKDENTKKLFKRIGFLNFFKYTISNKFFNKEKKIKINMMPNYKNKNEITISTDYFKYFYDNEKDSLKDKLIMPYYMYPRIYNSLYKKINIISKPNFNFRVFFSGSVVVDGYSSFIWKKTPEKFPNRIDVINLILKEFKNEVFLVNKKQDLKSNIFLKKKIILCLHDKMVKKTSYKLDFKDNFNLLSNSCFHLSCPGVVMPLCHHLIEGIKVGSIPITNCESLLYPNLDKNNCLNYSSLENLVERVQEALEMENDKVLYMRSKVIDYYKNNLSPKVFRIKFDKLIKHKSGTIICCDDHRSINNFDKN